MLANFKMMLGIADTDKDDLLKLILSMTTARLKVLIGGIDPPDTLDHIILEVSIIRYNRIGSEGMSSHSVEGESNTFTDDDFSGFADEIQAFLDAQKDTTRGKVRFI